MSRTIRRVSWWSVVACVMVAWPAAAQLRTSPKVDTRPQVEEVQPQIAFDKAQAVAALDKGNASITGVACSYHDGYVYLADNTQVMLFPATPYLDEWVRLRKKDQRNRVVTMSDDAYATRVETETDAKGNFRFQEMQPGRYYLFMQFAFNQAMSRDVYAGTSNTGYGAVNHYQRQDYTVARNDEMIKDVEIKPGDTTVKTALTRGGRLAAKLLPCK
ncbi:carboxypeptidase-like regulatory domain-containing protein [Pseudoxanthomonas sp. LjRoot143]|uniref:carboxypeptidase-like regulatory domain-containing protein n=1 Tax=unclassified Pseudoxanthomonas TaxID=2645906 RepID=UPI00177FEE12|nr:carboxypeptidase-like regulatory domain-containing protein [Pseudoxanthomonas sp. PXM01]MBD9471134.1 carboxypeptidase regulatory-like domain-containing protein [Pseudoxanthomonas sp. PXM01]